MSDTKEWLWLRRDVPMLWSDRPLLPRDWPLLPRDRPRPSKACLGT